MIQWIKYVDTSPSTTVKGGYSPMTRQILLRNKFCVHRYPARANLASLQ
jgi:hypothetical protein